MKQHLSDSPVATINVNLSTLKYVKLCHVEHLQLQLMDTDYQFVTVADVTASNTGSAVPFDSVKIYEGTYITTRYTVDTSDVDQSFTLNNPNSDTSTLTVKVQTSSSDTTTTTYTKATDITQLTSNSTQFIIYKKLMVVYMKFILVTV